MSPLDMSMESRPAAEQASAYPDLHLEELSVPELLRLDGAVLEELRRRGIARTGNKPVGDLAEVIVHKARGGSLEPNSTKSHDITDRNGARIQVKSLTHHPRRSRYQFSAFRSFDFDTAVFLIFDGVTFEILSAYEVPSNVLTEMGTFSRHVNARTIRRSQIEKVGADVTEEMRRAYATSA